MLCQQVDPAALITVALVPKVQLRKGMLFLVAQEEIRLALVPQTQYHFMAAMVVL
jgi:hypothetical protein